MPTFTVTIAGLTPEALADFARACEAEVGGDTISRIVIKIDD